MRSRFFIALSSLVIFVTIIVLCERSDHPSQSDATISAQASVHHNQVTQWFKIKPYRRLKGLALVIHGLNLKPDRMGPLIASLNKAGIDVLNVSLRGHGNNYFHTGNLDSHEERLEAFRTVTYSLWLDEVYKAYQAVKKISDQKKVPIFFAGYSLGGLMGFNLLASYPDVHFDRAVLLAPALNVSVESYLLKALTPFPGLVIDSLSPVTYRTNDGTPMAAYKALFEAIEHLEVNFHEKLNIPTLIFIDEKDEFISCQKLIDMMNSKKLDRWKIVLVQKDHDVIPGMAHHLIIDEPSIGKKTWKQMQDILISHLLL